MRFLSFLPTGTSPDPGLTTGRWGAVIDDQVVDLSARHPELPDLREAIRQDADVQQPVSLGSADPVEGLHRLGVDIDLDARHIETLLAQGSFDDDGPAHIPAIVRQR